MPQPLWISIARSLTLNKPLRTLGHHLLLELSGCESDLLREVKPVEKAIKEILTQAGATVIQWDFKQFEPHGVSGVVIIAESHLTIHTWPEHNYAAIDVFTCGSKAIPNKVSQLCSQFFKATHVEEKIIPRGPMRVNTPLNTL